MEKKKVICNKESKQASDSSFYLIDRFYSEII